MVLGVNLFAVRFVQGNTRSALEVPHSGRGGTSIKVLDRYIPFHSAHFRGKFRMVSQFPWKISEGHELLMRPHLCLNILKTQVKTSERRRGLIIMAAKG